MVVRSLFTGAVLFTETSPSNIRIDYLDSSAPSNPDNGASVFDYRYQLSSNQTLNDTLGAWNRFLVLLAQSDILELLNELPSTEPIAITATGGNDTAAGVPSPAVIPVLSFTDTQDVNNAVVEENEVTRVANRLKVMWANASGE